MVWHQRDAGYLRRAVLVAVLALVAGFRAQARAEPLYDFDLPAQPLAEALIEFGNQTGFQFFFESKLMEGKTAPAVEGTFTSREALDRLLDGTGISARVRAGSVLIFEQAHDGKEAIEPLERILTIGSRARGLGFGGITPITVIGSDEFAMKELPDAGQLFSDLPQSNPVISTENSNNLTLGLGIKLVDLRNLGPQRTLILVNGRRFAPTAAFPPVLTGTDVSTIPIDAAERIEVLTGSASTLYGSEAIAGVINFVLDSDLEGAEGSFLTGTSEEGDRTIFKLSLTGGKSFLRGRAHLVAHVTLSHEGKVLQRDRPGLSNPGAFVDGEFIKGAGGSPVTPTGVMVGLEDASGNFVPFIAGSSLPPLLIGQDGTGFEVFTKAPDQLFDFSPFQYLLTPKDRGLFYLNGRYEAGAQLEMYLSVLGGLSRTENQLAPPPLTFQAGQAIRIPFDNPFIPASLNPVVEKAVDAGAHAFFLDKRILEAGVRSGTVKKGFANVVFGITGPLGPFRKFDFAYQYSTVTTKDRDRTVIDVERAQAAADLSACAEFAGCTLIDYFGLNKITPAQINFLTAGSPAQQKANSTQHLITASLENTLFRVPSGKVDALVGLEFRREKFAVVPDPLTESRNQGGVIGLTGTSGSFTVAEGYADVVAPLMRNRGKVASLTWESAARLSHYSTVGTLFSWKSGFEYVPASGFRIRTMYQRGVRAPNIFEFLSPPTIQILQLADPCSDLQRQPPPEVTANCTGGSPLGNVPTDYIEQRETLLGTVSGNSFLSPERAHSVNLGFEYVPGPTQFLGGGDFYFSLALYGIRINDPIFLPGLPLLLEQCYESTDLSSPFCGTNPESGLPLFERDPANHQITNVNLAFLNGGSETVAGFDAEIRFSLFPEDISLLPAGSRIDFGIRYIFNSFQEFLVTEGGDKKESTGEVFRPKQRFLLQMTFRGERLAVQWNTRFQGAAVVNNELAGGVAANRAPAAAYHNLAASVILREGVNLTLGIDNLLNHKPPFLISGQNGTDTLPTLYDVIGRRVWIKLGAQF